MIKFFRRLRQNMIKNNRVSKYLLYAIGEIILVVIGILIALQINNWNEKRKVDGEILKILTEIRSNLITDSLSIQEIYQLKVEDVNIQYSLINKLENGNIPYDSIDFHLGRVMLARRIVLVDNGYQLMKELGLELLNNQELRNKLTSYYTNYVKKIYDDTGDDDYEFRTVFLSYTRNYFLDYNWGNQGVPADYEHLKSDRFFLTTLKINLKNEESTLGALLNGSREIQGLIPMLDRTIATYK